VAAPFLFTDGDREEAPHHLRPTTCAAAESSGVEAGPVLLLGYWGEESGGTTAGERRGMGEEEAEAAGRGGVTVERRTAAGSGGAARRMTPVTEFIWARQAGSGTRERCRRAGGASGCGRGETMRERRDESETLNVNRMVEKKGDGLRWNKSLNLMKINK
jgi:hypothetical protein